MAASYNNSAWFYDKLAKLVYGRALVEAQVFLLQFIPPGSRVLVAGGGTGWILDEITKLYPTGLQITYVEVAPKMMALSQKRNIGGNTVAFFTEQVEDVALAADYDVVITPFLFDNFTQQTLQKVFVHIHAALKAGGLWLNADFQLSGKWWQYVLLKTMFLFFKLICSIEASKLPAIKKQFTLYGYKLTAKRTFFGEFIVAEVYER